MRQQGLATKKKGSEIHLLKMRENTYRSEGCSYLELQPGALYKYCDAPEGVGGDRDRSSLGHRVKKEIRISEKLTFV